MNNGREAAEDAEEDAVVAVDAGDDRTLDAVPLLSNGGGGV